MGWLPRGEAARVYVAVTLLNAGDGLVSTITPPFLRHLGFPLESIGFLVSGYAIASLFSRFPAGRLADGRHARAWFLGACGLLALAEALYPVAVEPWAFWGTRAVHGLALGTATTLNFAAFLVVSQGSNRTQATALYTAAQSAGFAIGNFLAGVLADQFGFSPAYLVAAMFPILALLSALRRRVPSESLGRRAGGFSQWRALGRADVRAIPILAISVNLVHSTLNTLFPLYVLSIGLSLTVAGTARGVQSLTNVVARPFGDPLVRRLGVVGLACFGVTVTALGVAAGPLFTAPLLLIPLFVVVGIGRGCAVVANTLTTVRLSERGVLNRGSASAFITTGQDVASIVGPMLATTTAAAIGIGPTLQVIPAVAAVVGVAAMLAARRQYAEAQPRLAEVTEPGPGRVVGPLSS
jgi:MFS family permease